MKLAGQIAFITGASSGIGRAIALAFAAEGADCALVARGPAVAEAAAEVTALGRRAVPLRADMTDPEQVEAAVAAVERDLGPISLLVNSAGGSPNRFANGLIWETSVAEWDAYVALNLRSVFLVSRAVLRAGMLERRRGRIITLGSAAGRRPSNIAPYAAAKYGVSGLMARLGLDLLDYGIIANTICPTGVDTPLVNDQATPEQRAAWMTPAEVAAAALYLAADAPPHMTGQFIDLYPAGPPALPKR
jgi:3-oxoacyl-[acyl-carrier protein] reductase